MNTYCFTDIHGHKELFDKICQWLYDSSEPWQCYFLGDACDRMEYGYSIIKTLLADHRFIYLKGNHEDLFVRAAKALKQCWLDDNVTKAMAAIDAETYTLSYCWHYDVALHVQNGGLSTLMAWVADGSPMNIIGELERLPEHVEFTNNRGELLDLSHAGHLKDNSDSFIWSREHFDEKWEDGRMIHGHTPIRSLMKHTFVEGKHSTTHPAYYQEGTKICLDTSCFSSNCTNVLNLDTFEEYFFTTLI